MKKKARAGSKKKVSGNVSTYFDPLIGARVASDRVYEYGSDMGRTLTEWEFGKNLIVGTFASEPVGQSSFKANTQRYAIIGDFTYSKNGNIGGTIDVLAGGDYLYEGSYAPLGDETISISPPGAINSFADYRQSQSIFNNSIGANYLFFYSRNATPADITANAENGIFITTDKSGLAQFGFSSIFSGDWWTDPFAPNLV